MTEATNPYECIQVHENIYDAVKQLVVSGAMKDKKILDAGAGYQNKQRWMDAVGSNYWLGDLYIGLDVVTMDIRPECACQVTGDIEELDKHFENETFDVIFSFETLEHCLHPDRALANFWRKLKPDGALFISTPMAQPHHTPRHLWLFTEDGIRYLMVIAGFQVVKQVPLGGASGREWSWLSIGKKMTDTSSSEARQFDTL